MSDELLIEKLMKFGLTRQEAGIYLCLYNNGAQTGYEAAKLTGISRSNVYGALSGLVEKGAACVLEGSTNKYMAVEPDEFTDNCLKYLETVKQEILDNISRSTHTVEGYVTIEGYRHISDKIRNMLLSAEYRVYISASWEVLLLFKETMQEVIGKRKKFVIITDEQEEVVSDTLEWTEDNLICYRNEKKEKQFRLIIDSQYVLTGELTGNKTDTALYSAQTNFVNVFKEALKNEITLIELTRGEKK